MTPSKTKKATAQQVDKAVAKYRAMFEKHAGDFDSGAVQVVLGSKEFAKEQFELFRTHVELQSSMITRRVRVHVDRTRSPQEMLDATERWRFVCNGDVIASMPKGEGKEVDVIFFKIDKYITNEEFEEEYEKRGLVPADPYSLLQVNIDDHAFADAHPNATVWKNKNGTWCYAICNRWNGVLDVDVDQSDGRWLGRCWFAGVRKV